MDRLIYTALSGMNAAMNRQRMVANNLANSSTPGFRQEVFALTPATLRDGGTEARAMVRGEVRAASLSPARVNPTGQPLDIAVNGSALIAFQYPAGGEVYSRRGDLKVEPTGLLVNGEGLAVLGEDGAPITVPAGARIAIGKDGSVLATDPASPDGEVVVTGRIRLVTPGGSTLVKGVDSFLKVPAGGVLAPDPTATVLPGALEQSNVQTATTLVEMIDAQRAFEQRAKIIQTAGELDEASSGLLRMA